MPENPDRNLSNQARGAWGERLAAAHYRSLGYEVLDRNWRSSTGELDLVLHRRGTYVFSEVKTRRTAVYGPASAAVGPAKQRRIRQLSLEWLRSHGVHADVIRFDVVAITGTRLELFEAAY